MNNTSYPEKTAEIKKRFPKIFPNILYDENEEAIVGVIHLDNAYYYKKCEDIWYIRAGSFNAHRTVSDCYEIKVELDNTRPIVREMAGRIEKLAKMRNKTSAGMHLYPDGSCCLGIFPPYNMETLSETLSDFLIEKVYPYFVWQAYYEKYNEIPPCGELSHGMHGYLEIQKELEELGINDFCFCGKLRKLIECCGIDKRDSYLEHIGEIIRSYEETIKTQESLPEKI